MSGFLDYARLLWHVATTGPNALNEARRREREQIVRWLQAQAEMPWPWPQGGVDVGASVALKAASHMIAGGAHYR